jgi:hypothetical protein
LHSDAMRWAAAAAIRCCCMAHPALKLEARPGAEQQQRGPSAMMLLSLLLLHNRLVSSAPVPAGSPSQFWTGCESVVSPLTNRTTGTDYGGPNISVIRVNSSQDCCQACIQQTEPNCTVAVWHNLEEQSCALKGQLGAPFPGNRVAACRPVPCIPPACYPPAPPPARFRFSTAHSDHMVLQAAPSQAAVWGLTTAGDEVTVRFGDAAIKAVTSVAKGAPPSVIIWTAVLPPTKASFTAYTIEAHSKQSGATISIHEILFGDVWVCSGQSNMAYSLNGSNGNSIVHPPVNNSEAEFAE